MEHRTNAKPYVLHGIREELLEQLEMRKWSLKDLSRFSGLTLNEIDRIVQKESNLTTSTARRLSKAFGKPANYWVRIAKGLKNNEDS